MNLASTWSGWRAPARTHFHGILVSAVAAMAALPLAEHYHASAMLAREPAVPRGASAGDAAHHLADYAGALVRVADPARSIEAFLDEDGRVAT